MRIKLAFFTLLILALTTLAQAQKTTVTGVVQDSNGTAYASGTFNIDFVNGTGCGLPLLQGSPFQMQFTGGLDASGNLPSLSMADNNQVCAGSQWRFSICNSAGRTCFSTLITITGGSQSVSATLKSAAAILPGVGSATSLISNSANPASSGVERLANADNECWRNAGNTADICLTINGSNNPVLSGTGLTFTTDGYYFVPPESCHIALTTGTYAANPANCGGQSAPAICRAASGNPVLQLTTTGAANTTDLVCDITPPTRLTANKGITINTVDYMFGYQTTALTSIGTAALDTVTYGAAGGAAQGTVGTFGGSITVTAGTSHGTPGAVTTTGQCYHESLALGTPYAHTTDNTRLTLQNTFVQSGAAATVLQVCGAIVRYTISNPF